MTAYLFGYDCTLADYLTALTDQEIADLYANRMGYCVYPGLAYRYVAWDTGGNIYHLVEIPTRQEMIAEIIQQEES